jgi:hypothetical protein
VGDGQNLDYVSRFPHQPPDVAKRLRASLYPLSSDGMFEDQRNTLLELIDDVERLATSRGYVVDRWTGLS